MHVLEMTASLTCDQGRQPSVREIADHLGHAGVNAVTGHLAALERKGWLESTGRARGRKILRTPEGLPFSGFKG